MATITPPPDGGFNDRCSAFELLDGDVILYDERNPDAWIQSSAAVDFADVHGTGHA
jgi:hypothetical protein